jgi:hypothetical protein
MTSPGFVYEPYSPRERIPFWKRLFFSICFDHVFFSLEKSVCGTQCIFLLIWLCGKHLLVYIATIKPVIVQPASKIGNYV